MTVGTMLGDMVGDEGCRHHCRCAGAGVVAAVVAVILAGLHWGWGLCSGGGQCWGWAHVVVALAGG